MLTDTELFVVETEGRDGTHELCYSLNITAQQFKKKKEGHLKTIG